MSDLMTLKELADHLQLSERTVYRLLGTGDLPGFKVGSQWRFRRSVVDYWLDLRLARLDPASRGAMLADWGASEYALSNALDPRNAHLTLAGGSPPEVIREMIRAVTFPEPVDADQVLARVWDREQLASTAIEGGITFLHTSRWGSRLMRRNDLLAIGRLAPGANFGAPDGALTTLLFLLLARDAGQQLILLAKATDLCRHPGVATALRAATSAEAVTTVIREAERAMG
jgi:excisionase family DNA binding protein